MRPDRFVRRIEVTPTNPVGERKSNTERREQ
jgi:hypothetical protein